MFCLNCGYGGEEKTLNDELICPRCHATGAYLLDVPALAQGPMWEINPDDSEYGSIYELDMERDQDTGFTNPNLHRRAEKTREGEYVEVTYPESKDVPPSDFQKATVDGIQILTAYTGSETHVKIPEGFVSAGYTTLGAGLFTDTDVVYVEIPEGITTIE